MRLQPPSEHPHGLSDADFDLLFTRDKPIIFAYHGYPWLIHRLTYRRTNHRNLHVRGYKEEGTITTPFDMAVLNDLDRFHLAGDAVDRLPQLGRARRLSQAADGGPADRAPAATSASTARTCRRSATGAGRPRPQGKTRMHSIEELASGFRALGIAAGDTVMVHASVRAVGEVAGGPDADSPGAQGRSHRRRDADDVCQLSQLLRRGRPRTPEPEQERELIEKLPAFDPLTARAAARQRRARRVLRTYPGSIVNPHVARFVVWGRHAGHLFSQQPWNYAFGRGSALERFAELDGRILLLGCDHDTVTFLHYAEHIVDIPDKQVARYKVPVVEDGRRVWREMEEFDTSDAGAHANWPDRFFARIVDTYLAQTGNRGGRVGDAECFLLDAAGCWSLRWA